MAENEPKKIAVVGGGISGIAAAYLLAKQHDVTLFEAAPTLGGHTNTRVVEDPKYGPTPVDTGFIVCNARNYPNFYRLLDEWEVPRRDSEMSFGFYCESSGLQYVGPSIGFFLREPRNLINPRFLGMLREQGRFNRKMRSDLLSGRLADVALKSYLKEVRASSFFLDHYLAPLIAAIWSSPDLAVEDFPTATFATFFNNHGMLNLSERPQWHTIIGGSHTYLNAFQRNFRGTLRTGTPITHLSRGTDGVTVGTKDGSSERFDSLVVAVHGDEVLKLLSDPDPQEEELFKVWRYSRNHTVLHTDPKAMSPKRRLWASWNYRRRQRQDKFAPVAITYYMNLLQGLRASQDYFVTLNNGDTIDESKILYETVYTHPIYTPSSVQTQQKILARNGHRNTYFCGAYLRYGFHEDGVWSAIQATNALTSGKSS